MILLLDLDFNLEPVLPRNWLPDFAFKSYLLPHNPGLGFPSFPFSTPGLEPRARLPFPELPPPGRWLTAALCLPSPELTITGLDLCRMGQLSEPRSDSFPNLRACWFLVR